MLVADPDGHLVECEIISSHTKESIFQKSIPVLHPALAALFGFLNLVPGKLFYKRRISDNFLLLQDLELFLLL